MQKFTNKWFQGNTAQTLPLLKSELPENAKILEIGSFEGQSTVWFLQNFLQSQLTCIDPFTGSPENSEKECANLFDRFSQNTAEFADRITVLKGYSNTLLPQLITEKQQYDLVYIDGSHYAPDVLLDAVCAFELVQPGGLITFDDYTWRKKAVALPPRPAIKSFMHCYSHEIEVLDISRQCTVRRLVK